MKTAMKELEDKLKDNLKWIVMNADYELMDKLFSEGFEKEKEQIIDAHTNAYLIGEDDISVEDANEASIKYYNLTYNQNK
jgi:hypothetical protein